MVLKFNVETQFYSYKNLWPSCGKETEPRWWASSIQSIHSEPLRPLASFQTSLTATLILIYSFDCLKLHSIIFMEPILNYKFSEDIPIKFGEPCGSVNESFFQCLLWKNILHQFYCLYLLLILHHKYVTCAMYCV